MKGNWKLKGQWAGGNSLTTLVANEGNPIAIGSQSVPIVFSASFDMVSLKIRGLNDVVYEPPFIHDGESGAFDIELESQPELPFIGLVTIEASDGSTTVSTLGEIAPPSSLDHVIIVDPIDTGNGATDALPELGDAIYFDSAEVSITANNTIESVTAPSVYYHHSQSNGLTSYTAELEDAVVPELVIQGPNPLVLQQGQVYNDPVVTTTGPTQGAITATGIVDVNEPGTYTRTFSGPTDANGNEVDPVTLTIIVEASGAVTAPSSPPIADAGSDITVKKGKRFNLDGSESQFFVKGNRKFEWRQISGPHSPLETRSPLAPIGVAPAETGQLQYELVVTDELGRTDNDVVVVTVANTIPKVSAGPNLTMSIGGRAMPDAFVMDEDADDLVIGWTQISGPSVTLKNANTLHAYFDATEAGTVVLELTVTDGDAILTDQMSFTIEEFILPSGFTGLMA